MNRRFVAALLVVLALGLFQAGNSASLAGGAPVQASAPPSGKNTDSSDVKFARTTFTKLANGDQAVAGDIDWEHFKASGQDIGAIYNSFHDEPNHKAFRKSFISSFSKSFRDTGARAESLKNWKVKSSNGNQTVVSGETLSKSHLLITISKKSSNKKMAGIQSGP